MLLLKKLASYFELGTEDILGKISILFPPFDLLDSLAVCRLKKSYYSTLLIGIEKGLKEERHFRVLS